MFHWYFFMWCYLGGRSHVRILCHPARLAASAALLPTSQSQGVSQEVPYLKKLVVISQRLKEYLRKLKWPKVKHLEVAGVNYKLPLSSAGADMLALRRTVPRADMDYLAGFFDGDGCVTVQPNLSGCRLTVTQQVFGQEVLLTFLCAFGGAIHLAADGRGCTRPVLQWRISGQSAKSTAKLLSQHCIVKKQQLEIAMIWPSSTLERLRCRSKLQELKMTPLSPVQHGMISWSYVTGFFDAEGCIAVSPVNKSVCIDIAQKDTAVLKAIKCFLQSHAGLSDVAVPERKGRSCSYIRVCSSKAVTRILQQLLSYGLLVKQASASQVLTSVLLGVSHLELREVGFSGKGNQGRYRRLDADGCARAQKIRALQSQSTSKRALSESLRLRLVLMRLEHKIATTQSKILKLRADVMSVQQMHFKAAMGSFVVKPQACLRMIWQNSAWVPQDWGW